MRKAGLLMVAPAVEGIDLFKVAGRSTSGWIPSLKRASPSGSRSVADSKNASCSGLNLQNVDGRSQIQSTFPCHVHGRLGKEATLPSPPPLRTVRAPFNAYRSSTDKPGSNPAGRELSLSTFTFLLTLSVITCCQLMQGRDSEIKPTSSFPRIPVYDTLQ